MPTLPRRALLLGTGSALFATALSSHATAQPPSGGPHQLPALPYAHDANSAAIDAQTMELHHGRHHRSYVTNLNSALEGQDALGRLPLEELLARLDQAPTDIRAKLRNNGGGHANHSMFWQVMGGDGGEPEGELRAAIERDFGGMSKFRERFDSTSSDVFGSGWAFVTVTREGSLDITRRPNQDTPLMEGERVLMGNDLWEHAYYLRYQNRRDEYIAGWWKVLHWGRIGERYAAAKAGRLGI
jgi:superoxide dismutase, Fe-Mn family